MLQGLILVFHVLAAGAIVVLVLLQQGKGADMGAAFGSGSAGSLFGSSGSANFLSRVTAILATVFFCTSLLLTYLGSEGSRARSLMEQVPAPAVPAPTGAPQVPVPVAPAADPSVPLPSGTPALPQKK